MHHRYHINRFWSDAEHCAAGQSHRCMEQHPALHLHHHVE